MSLLTAAAELARFLEGRSVPYAIIGGLALQHWGEPRLTRDVDVTVLVSPGELEEFVEAVLARFRPRTRDARSFALRHRVLLVEAADGVPVDISLGIPGYEEEALQRAVRIEFAGAGPLCLLGAEDLIIHKCVAGRPRDLEDIEGILVHQGKQTDLPLIRRWLAAFQQVVEDHDPLHIFEQALTEAWKLMGQDAPDAEE